MNNSLKITTEKGPFEELFPKFLTAFGLSQGLPGLNMKVRVISGLLVVKRESINGWFREKSLPTGLRRAKFMLLMSLCGYQATEREEFLPEMLVFFDTVATAIDSEGVTKLTGFKQKAILEWFREKPTPKKEVLILIHDFNKKYENARREAVLKWVHALKENGFIDYSPPVVVRENKQEVLVKEVLITAHPANKNADQAIVHILKALQVTLSPDFLADNNRTKVVRQGLGHAELADLIGKLQKLSMASFNLN